LTEAALNTDKAILGICRGIQVLNVALGGTLYQDIPSQCKSEICHRMNTVSHDTIHSVILSDPLQTVLGKSEIMVNSYHHQAVKSLGEGLVITARCEDGVVEGICLPHKRFVHGVQWHPELLTDENTKKLFQSFVVVSNL